MSGRGAAFAARYGPWAVVAGASVGLGEAFATDLARRGLHLLLVARRPEPLQTLAARLSAAHGVQVRALPLDLGLPGAGRAVEEAAADLDVGLLVCNAALSLIGPFLEQPLEAHLTEIDVNCRAPLELCHRLGRRLAARGRGGIVLMSSLGATMGSALIANYAATKAYNLVLAEGLWEELRPFGVAVLACAAGAVRTPGYVASAPGQPQATLEPDAVVAETLRSLGRSPHVVPGRANRVAAFALRRLLPRAAAIRLMGAVMRRLYGGP